MAPKWGWRVGGGAPPRYSCIPIAASEASAGRRVQVPGEDPHLTSRYAVNFVKGLQVCAPSTRHLSRIGSCTAAFTGEAPALLAHLA